MILRLRLSCWIVIVVTTLAVAAPVHGQVIGNDPRVKLAVELLRTWLDGQRAYEQIPGISVAVVHDQELVWSGGFGMADISRKSPATAGTIYSICSISKLFTSVGVMQLRDAGKLRLDDPVEKHLPWFAIKRSAPDAGSITIEGLLTHASGLPRESDYPSWTGPDYPFPTHDQIVARLREQETLYPPETYFQYSNLGLTLAGEVVAAESGMPYAEYARTRILDPLGMTSTTPEMPERERGKRLATGYSALTREGTRPPVPFYQTRGIAPAAGYASNAEDMARFASWQFRALTTPKNELLAGNTLREMQRVHFVDPDWETTYGLGFSVWRHDGKTFVGHGGSCPGYRSHLLLRPNEKIATVFLSNALGVNAQLWAERAYEIMGGALRAAAKGPAAVSAGDPSFDRYLGSYEWGWGEMVAVQLDSGLALLSLPTTDPMHSLTKLKKTGEHTFRRIRSDESLGEPYVFTMGSDGRAAMLTYFNNNLRRVR